MSPDFSSTPLDCETKPAKPAAMTQRSKHAELVMTLVSRVVKKCGRPCPCIVFLRDPKPNTRIDAYFIGSSGTLIPLQGGCTWNFMSQNIPSRLKQSPQKRKKRDGHTSQTTDRAALPT